MEKPYYSESNENIPKGVIKNKGKHASSVLISIRPDVAEQKIEGK